MTASQKDLLVLWKVVNHCIRYIHEKGNFGHIEDSKRKYYWGDIQNLDNTEFNKLLNDMQNGQSNRFLNNLIIEKTE